MKNKRSEDLLYFGLPAVSYRHGHLIYSPYKNEIIFMTKKEMDTQVMIDDLFKTGFIKLPSQNIDNTIRLFFIITEKCQLNCTYCFGCYGGNKNQTENLMPTKLATDILKEKLNEAKKENKKIKIFFNGGEPSLNFDLIKDVVVYLNKKRISVDFNISTNGIISEKNLDFLIKNNFFFRLTCDGSPSIHNIQRPFFGGGPSYNIVAKTIKILNKRKASYLVKMVVTPASLGKMIDSAKSLINLGVKNLRIDPVKLHGRALGNYKPTKTDLFINNFLKILEYIDINKKNVSLASIFIGRFSGDAVWRYCRFAGDKNSLVVNWDGNLTKCVVNVSNSNHRSFFTIGKVKDGKIKIDQNKKHLIEDISVDSMDDCTDCFVKYLCGGSCVYNNILANSNPLTPDKFDCDAKRKMIKNLIIYFYERKRQRRHL